MPSNVWTTIEVSLESCLRFTGDKVDLNTGPITDYIYNKLSQGDDLLAHIINWQELLSQQYRSDTIDGDTYFSQLPGLLFFQGPQALTNWLSEPANLIGMTAFNAEFTLNWLRKLTPKQQELVITPFSQRTAFIAQTSNPVLVTITRYCVELNRIDLASKLCLIHQLEEEAALQPAVLAALHDAQPELLDVAVRQTLAQVTDVQASDNTLIMSVYLLSVYNAAHPGISDSQASSFAKYIEQHTSNSRQSAQFIHLYLALAQYELVKGQIKSAKKKSDKAIKLAKAIGHPALLCQSLEREASMALELNLFREAQKQSSALIELAYGAHIVEFERLGYERLIETHARRANWTEAYELIDTYYRRCDEEDIDKKRVDSLLNAIEEGRL